MKSLLCLAALHFNENSSRAPDVANERKAHYISSPKARKGNPVINHVKVKHNYDYAQNLMEEVIIRRKLYLTYSTAHEARTNEMNHTPPVVSAS
ncbi:hypothetical protein ACJMK2_043483 [Sinanodonta woodiana]|uniref:Uncharacterized protein n=1 Tax=Sinanodonta woodiana TaxID=1069815 RepID=A0ABD3W0L6_SINWO